MFEISGWIKAEDIKGIDFILFQKIFQITRGIEERCLT